MSKTTRRHLSSPEREKFHSSDQIERFASLSRREIEELPPEALRPRINNPRTHSRRQRQLIAKSIRKFGFINPVIIDENMQIIAGHGRVEAAKELGLSTVPTVRVSHLNEDEIRAYVIADNALAAKSRWDRDLLGIELQGLIELGFDIEIAGFEIAEADLAIEEWHEAGAHSSENEDDIVDVAGDSTVTRAAEVWNLGTHKLYVGDARSRDSYSMLMDGETADMVITDPPYNTKIAGNVSGLGKIKHTDFVMASGEMSSDEFQQFLSDGLTLAISVSRDGALHYVFMDWRQLYVALSAARHLYGTLINICVWNKNNGGMGSFYRSKSEFVLVFKVGSAFHTNNIQLGKHGWNRTNVWDYAGVNTFRAGRTEELAMHPTVKPVALIADAIKDATRRNDIVLDPFCGSGTTVIACEKTGRRARMIEIDVKYADVAIRRWQRYTGKSAFRGGTSLTFDEAAEQRCTGDSDKSSLKGGRS